MPTIEITRKDLSISQLRAEAARTADAKQARRILAIAMVRCRFEPPDSREESRAQIRLFNLRIRGSDHARAGSNCE